MPTPPRKDRQAEIEFRPTRREDLSELLSLWNDGRVMRWVGFPDGLGYDAAGIDRWFERLQANPRRHHFVARSTELGFCGELYYAVDVRHRRAGLDIKFRPEAQGGGRSSTALRALIRRVFEIEREVDAVWTEPSATNLAARTLYWSCGLRETNRPLDMEPGIPYWELTRGRWRSLTSGGADDVSVRMENEADHPEVLEVNRLAFGGTAEAQLVDALQGRTGCLSLVACAGGCVVGQILFSPVRIDGPSAQVRAAGLGPMAVVPGHQRQGIGSRLVRAGLEECRRFGYEAVIVLGHPGYYPRFGFLPAHLNGLHWEHPVSPDAFLALELVPGALTGGGGIVSYLPELGSV